MNRQWTFTLGYERAPKGLNANDRPTHWAVKHASTQNVRLFVSTEIRALNIPTLQKCRVDVVWVVNTRHRRDEDNLAPFLKAIYDGIGADKGISAHIVPDDAPQYMEKVGATIRYEKDAQPHFEITITEVAA